MTTWQYWRRWIIVGAISVAAVILLGRMFWVNPILERIDRVLP